MAMPSWRRLLLQAMLLPDSLARASAGSSMAARIAMMAITTSSSIKVNAGCGQRALFVPAFILVYETPDGAFRLNFFTRKVLIFSIGVKVKTAGTRAGSGGC